MSVINSRDLVGYSILVEDAMKMVIRQVLGKIASDGLLGNHYLVISFKTDFEGVVLPARIKDRYPNVMPVILRNCFSKLKVCHSFFGVDLTFSGVTESIIIPFGSIVSFTDPAVGFELCFDSAISSDPSISKPNDKLDVSDLMKYIDLSIASKSRSSDFRRSNSNRVANNRAKYKDIGDSIKILQFDDIKKMKDSGTCS